MADENIIIDVFGKVVPSSFVKAGEEGAKIAQKSFRPIQVDADFSKLVSKIGTSKISFNQLTESTRDFGDSLERGLSRITALGAASTALFGIARAFESSIQAARNLEASLKNINVILNLPTDKLQDFGKQLFDVSRQTKQSFSEVAAAAQEFSRQGLSAAETVERTRAALLLSNLASIDAVKATETITAAINSFYRENLKAIDVVNKLVSVDAKFAVSSADLAEALTRVGSTAQDAGVGFDKLIALVTGAQQVTQRGGSVIGNALNTIFTRLKRADTLEQLELLGIQVREVEAGTGRLTGALVPADRILAQLGEKFKTLNQEQKANVAETVAGVRQLNVLTGVFASLGIAQEAYVTSVNASNEAVRRQSELLETQDARIKNLGTSFQQLGANVAKVGFGDRINTLLKGLTDSDSSSISANIAGQVIKAFSGTGEAVGNEFASVFIKSISDVISGPGLIAIGLIGVKISQVLSKFVGEQFKNINIFSGDNLEAQKNITSALGSQSEKALQILRTEQDKVLAEQQILNLIKQQNALLAEGAALRSSLNAIVSSPQARAVIKERPVKNAAGGLIDAISREQSAIGQGVGGASATAKPVVLPNFNGGTAVANTDEYLVKNYAGKGKDAIFNKEMASKMGLPENAEKIKGGSLSALDSRQVLRYTSAPIAKLFASGKFTEAELIKYLNIKNLSAGFIKNYADVKALTDREVALGSTFSIPLQRSAYPSQIIPQRGQTKRIAEKLLGLGLSRGEVTDFLKGFRGGRSSSMPFQQGRGKTPFLIQDETFGKRDFLSLFLTPKDILPNVQASNGYVPNYAGTNHKLKLTRTGIIQRELPNGEKARPSEGFLTEAYQNYHRTEIEGVLRAFEKQGRFLTEEEFLSLTRQNQQLHPLRPASSFAEGSIPNFATGDEALFFIQNIIRELSTGAQRLALENKAPFGQNQIVKFQPRPTIPPGFNINPPVSSPVPRQLLLENKQPQSAFNPFIGVTSTQTNSTLSPALFAAQEQERQKLEAINRRAFLSQQPKPFAPLGGSAFEFEGSRRQAQNALFQAGIDKTIKTIAGFDKDLLDNSNVLKKLINASVRLQEEYITGTKTQSQFNKISARISSSLENETKRLTTARPTEQTPLPTPTFGQRVVNRLGGRDAISSRAGTASFVLPFLAEGIGSIATGGIQDPIEKARAQRGISTASTGLSTAAFVASIAPNPVGLGVAGTIAIGSVLKGIKDAVTETEEDRAIKFRNFANELQGQQTTIQSARKAVLDFSSALEDSTISEKQRLSFQKEALSSIRGIQDPRVASTLRQQVLSRDFSAQNQAKIDETLAQAFKSQERQLATNTDNLTNAFDKIFRETQSSNAFGISNKVINNVNEATSFIPKSLQPAISPALGVFNFLTDKKNFGTGPQGISNESATALRQALEADITSLKTVSEQNTRRTQLTTATESALAQSKVLSNTPGADTGAFLRSLNQALPTAIRQANAGRIAAIATGEGDTRENIASFTAILTQQLRELSLSTKDASIEQQDFAKVINRTSDSIKQLGDLAVRDVRESSRLDIARNQRVIGQSLDIQTQRNLGVGTNTLQFTEFSNNIVNAQEEASRQQLDEAKRLRSVFIQSFLKGSDASTIETSLNEPGGLSGLRNRLGSVNNIDQFLSEIEKVKESLVKTGGAEKLVLGIEELGNTALVASEKIKAVRDIEIERNKQLSQAQILSNRLNPNKEVGLAGISQQINQSNFLSGLSPTTTEEISRASKEQLNAVSKLLDFAEGLTGQSPELRKTKDEVAIRAQIADVKQARQIVRDLDVAFIKGGTELKAKIIEGLEKSAEILEDKQRGIEPGDNSIRTQLIRGNVFKPRSFEELIENESAISTGQNGLIPELERFNKDFSDDLDQFIEKVGPVFGPLLQLLGPSIPTEVKTKPLPTLEEQADILRKRGGLTRSFQDEQGNIVPSRRVSPDIFNFPPQRDVDSNVLDLGKAKSPALPELGSLTEATKSTTKNVEDLNKVVKDIGTTIQTSFDKGVQLVYGGSPIDIQGIISLTLNDDQVKAMSSDILQEVAKQFGEKFAKVDFQLNATKENLKVLNKETNVAIPPTAAPNP